MHDDRMDTLVYSFMIASGLCAVDGKIVDQETKIPVKVKGKDLKYSADGKSVTLHKDEIMFNPLQDPRQAKLLCGIFLEKEMEENDLYTQTQYDIVKDDSSAVELRTNQGVYTSNYYRNNSLKYVDIVLQLNEEPTDYQEKLKDFDALTPKKEAPKSTRGRKKDQKPVKKSFFE